MSWIRATVSVSVEEMSLHDLEKALAEKSSSGGERSWQRHVEANPDESPVAVVDRVAEVVQHIASRVGFISGALSTTVLISMTPGEETHCLTFGPEFIAALHRAHGYMWMDVCGEE